MVQEHLTPAEQAISVKHLVLTKLPLLEHGAIHEESGEMWAYDPSRAWRISTMTTDPTDGGPVVTTALDRPLLAQPVDSMCIPPTAIPEAFSDHGDGMCVPRQLAAILGEDWEELSASLSEVQERLYGGVAPEQGITPRSVLEFCKIRNFAVYIYHGRSLAHKYVPRDKTRVISLNSGKSLLLLEAPVDQGTGPGRPETTPRLHE
jgi:hypothetical protein